jgi:hypothetical protein
MLLFQIVKDHPHQAVRGDVVTVLDEPSGKQVSERGVETRHRRRIEEQIFQINLSARGLRAEHRAERGSLSHYQMVKSFIHM